MANAAPAWPMATSASELTCEHSGNTLIWCNPGRPAKGGIFGWCTAFTCHDERAAQAIVGVTQVGVRGAKET
jgi:hypothetical protein